MKLTKYYKLLGFHVLLAIAVFIFKPLATLYFLLVTVFFCYQIFMAPIQKKAFYVLVGCAYVVGSEVFLRMNGGTFFYEACKYLVIVFSIIGLLTTSFNNKVMIYVLYILLLIPGIFVAVAQMGFETDIRKAIAFNLSGPVCLGVSAIFCYGRTVSFNQLKTILMAFLLPLVSITVYLFLYTPDLQSVITGTESNFATSGGFGPNQVATVLGLGMFILTVRFFLFQIPFGFKIFDLFILGLMSFRALVTFSRGGVITSLAMIVLFIILYYFKSKLKTKRQIFSSLIVFSGLVVSIWIYSSVQTSGFIEKRYANQDAAGREKEDVTTGRTDLVAFEFNEFINNPLLGIGVGKVAEVRLNETGIQAASHNEISRILAEHGSFGVFAFLILLITPLVFRMRNKSNLFFFSFYVFWLLTVNHSAMRIAAPAFIYGLCLLNIKYETTPVHRKSVIAKG
jgi:O-antigen ligase